MTDGAKAALEALVRGRVQGVGFRAFVVAQGRALGLAGFARNLADGRSVQVVAEGPHDLLVALLTALEVGPRASRVERVDRSWVEATGAYAGFEVR